MTTSFNDVGVDGKFNGLSLSNTLDVFGKGVFVAHSVFQVFDLGQDIRNDIAGSNAGLIDSLSPATIDKAGQVGLDFTFGLIGTFGVPGAVVGLGYAFREPLIDASKTNFENQVKEHQFNIDNNLLPRIGPK